MNERLRVLAEQAGFVTSHYSVGGIGWIWVSDGYPIDNQLERFAELIRQDEREACVKLLEDFSKTGMVPVKDTWRMGLIAGANAIRARSKE